MPPVPPLNHPLAGAEGPAEVCKAALQLPPPRAHRVNCIKSYMGPTGGKEKHLSGYLEVVESTSEGTKLHGLIMHCANKLC